MDMGGLYFKNKKEYLDALKKIEKISWDSSWSILEACKISPYSMLHKKVKKSDKFNRFKIYTSHYT
jgi:hypothetical protein